MINLKTITSLALAGSIFFALNAVADYDRREWRDRDDWRGRGCHERCEDAEWPHACYEHCKREHKRHHWWMDALEDLGDDIAR